MSNKLPYRIGVPGNEVVGPAPKPTPGPGFPYQNVPPVELTGQDNPFPSITNPAQPFKGLTDGRK